MSVREVSPEETEALRERFREFMRLRPDITWASWAQYTTLAERTVRAWGGGAMPGGVEVQSELRRALEQAIAGEILQPGGPQSIALTEDAGKRVRRVAKVGAFYETQTVLKIAKVLDYCAEECAIGVVTADFGCGKTEAVKHWRRKKANKVESSVFEFDQFSSRNTVDFVRCLARQFDLANDVGSQNGGLVFRDICAYLRDNPCLLIFDQCETARPGVCQIIRQIHDRTADAGVGVTLLAAPILLRRLLAGKMADLGALASRIGIYAALTGMTRNEMADIVKQEGFAEVDEAAFDLWYRACGGSMRRLMRSLTLLKSKHAGKRIGEKTIVGVAGHLWGMAIGEGA